MFKLFLASFLFAAISAAPGYPDYSYDIGHSAPIYSAPAIYKSEPIYSAPVYKAAPVYETPIYKTPVYEPAPIIKTIQPVVKTVATPIVKAYAPATSYASVTTYNVAHTPVVKTIVAPQPIIKLQAQPIIKSVIPAQPIYKSYDIPSYGHDYSYGYH